MDISLTHQHVWDTAKTLPRGKSVTLNAYFRNEKSSNCKKLGKKEQNKHKASGKKEVIRAEIIETENRESIETNP